MALDLLIEEAELPVSCNEYNQLLAVNKKKIRLGCKGFSRVSDMARFLGREEDWETIAKGISRRVGYGYTIEKAIAGALDIVQMEWENGEKELFYKCPYSGRLLVIQAKKNTQSVRHSNSNLCKSHKALEEFRVSV